MSTLEVYLSGGVANEGIYTFSEDSSLRNVLQTAGGITEEADLASIRIHIPTTDESLLIEPQKVNINRAEAWLLEALPGIGATLAQRIIEYRENNGPFHNIDELTRVEGIGTTTLEKIRDKISVLD
jgi:competence protein ComEA